MGDLPPAAPRAASVVARLAPVGIVSDGPQPLRGHPLLHHNGQAAFDPHSDDERRPAVGVRPPAEHVALGRRHLQAGLADPDEPRVSGPRPLAVLWLCPTTQSGASVRTGLTRLTEPRMGYRTAQVPTEVAASSRP